MGDPVETQKDIKKEVIPGGPEKDPDQNLVVKGRFSRYNSPFLQLMIPVLTTRYMWLAIEDINPLNFLKKPNPALKPDFEAFVKPNMGGYIRRNFAALGMGATTLGLIAYYSKRTAEDVKTLYAEAVAYELDKKPQDVDWNDIFVKSKNAALEVTRDAYVKRTISRFIAGSAFLVPWHKMRDWKNDKPKYDANANAGVGAIGAYLSLDGFRRKPSFFDTEQNMVAETINHTGENTHETISTKNIQTLLMLQRRHLDKEYKWPQFSSEDGMNQSVLSTRIADLLNQTYNNASKTEEANFTIGKFNFLVGFRLLDKFPDALAYVELANKSTDMKDVKQVSALIKGGETPQAAFAQFGVDMNALVLKHTDRHTGEGVSCAPQKKFTDLVTSNKEKMPQVARSAKDFASMVDFSGTPGV